MNHVRDGAGIPFVAMVRPRPGDFRYSDAEWRRMLDDAERVVKAGARGVVFGVLSADRRIDADRVRRMRDLVRSFPSREVVFHRAIDETENVMDAFRELAALDVDRVLTSGGAPTAMEGRSALRALVAESLANGGRPQVVVGGGVRANNVGQILRETQCRQIHSACSQITNDRLELDSHALQSLIAAVRQAALQGKAP